jgi:hypothetical protein
LSKHIKKYHPGHSQDLTPVPLQDDELLNLQQQNQTQTMTGTNAKTSTVKPSSSSTTANAQAIVISNATTNNADQADNKLFGPLLPRHPVQQEDLIGFSKDTTVSDTSIDPSLDDNILDLLTDDTDSPMLLSSISPGPSLPPPPPPPMPPPKTSSNIAAATIVSSKLHEVLTQGRPKAGPASSSDQQAFVVPTSSMKSNKTTTHIVNLAPVNASTSSSSPSFKNKPLAISISQVFACAQPLPLQEDAKHGNKGKQTTMADLETRGSASSVLSANAAFVQGLVNARKTGTTIIATSGSGGNIIRTNNQQVSIIKPASSSSSSLASLKQTLTSPMSSSPSSIHSTTIATSNTAACSKTFVCDFKGCNKSFEKVTFLKRHAKLHSSNCKFVCDVCTKCFKSQSKLDDHYRKHTGAKPFICHICGNAFRYKGDRTKHLKNIHGVLKSATASVPTTTPESTNGGNGANVAAAAFIAEDTSSSISSFQSTSDQSSVAGSLVESPTKSEPLDPFVNSNISMGSSSSSSMMTISNSDNLTETITMTLEDINQFAQDIY